MRDLKPVEIDCGKKYIGRVNPSDRECVLKR